LRELCQIVKASPKQTDRGKTRNLARIDRFFLVMLCFYQTDSFKPKRLVS
jgi:hypothetical protein